MVEITVTGRGETVEAATADLYTHVGVAPKKFQGCAETAPPAPPETEAETSPPDPGLQGDCGGTAPDETPEVDAAGVPWDERIHTSTKSTLKDGTWRRKSKIDDAFYDEVLAEITGAEQAAPVDAPPAPPAPPSGETEEIATDTPDAPAPPAPPSSEPGDPFVDLVRDITQNAPSDEDIETACAALGITDYAELKTKPQFIPAFRAMTDLAG